MDRAATGTSKSAVFRRFDAATETALAELLAAPLGELDPVALMVDGVHFRPRRIPIDRKRAPACGRARYRDRRRERGLDTSKPGPSSPITDRTVSSSK